MLMGLDPGGRVSFFFITFIYEKFTCKCESWKKPALDHRDVLILLEHFISMNRSKMVTRLMSDYWSHSLFIPRSSLELCFETKQLKFSKV